MSTIYTADDIRRLEKTISIREQLIDNLLKQELPTKARDIDAFVNLLDSSDNSIFSKAKIALDETNNRVNEETKEVLCNLLLELHKGNNNPIVENGRSIPPVYKSTDEIKIQDGELISKIDYSSIQN